MNCESDSCIELTADFCEFIGAFIGDGCIGKYDRVYNFQITGDRTLDKEYYQKRLIPCLKSIFPNLNYHIYERKSFIRLVIYSKQIVLLFHKRLGFPLGKKSHTVTIPDEILKLPRRNVAALLRGLFDTDGSLFFDKRKIYLVPYPRIDLHIDNQKLTQNVFDLLTNLFKIKTTITNNRSKIQINGKNAVKDFVNKIGFSNPRHYSKLSGIGNL